ncbi:MAG: DNA-directed RNA polymerase subunit omega [Kiritimatiellae bacterium]|jgi:DNA-directed RNA polymerase subunit omega|nr:DNA-directed RNA polymerase subunit omega [Kiritimatiellia bacterium]MDD3441327.1 DNA-directed RNA polymerase subunit omega [Kiritimatiellia bacterium]MDD4116625.1 DNA-directed RNA polymerase subunit omega [Kiritimatiellia bacterium]NCC92964.1 DNA-directed RNA polymerase subunit omega [Opitutae bacterium]
MNATYLEKAKERMPNIPLLVNVVSKRVRQLNAGQRPLIKPDTPDMDHLDLALKEVAEGKLSAELGALPTPRSDAASSLLAL